MNLAEFVLLAEAPAITVLLLLLMREITKARISKKDALIMAGLFLISLSFRLMLPHTMRLFFDEDIYLEMGYNMARHFRSGLCLINGDACEKMVLMKWPALNPAWAALGFVSGINLRIWYILMSSMIPVAAYLIGRNFSQKSGIIAGMLLAFHPLLGLWGTEFAAENIMALSFMVATWMYIEGNIPGLILASAVAAQSKPEAAVIFVLPLLKTREVKKHLLVASVAAILLIPYFIHLYLFMDNPWGAEKGPRFSLGYVQENLMKNLAFYLDYRLVDRHAWLSKQLLHPAIITVLGILGLRYLRGLWLPILILFMIYASFYGGSVDYGTDVRYQIPIVAAVTAAAGILLGKFKNIPLLLAVAIAINYLALMPAAFMSPSAISEASQARQYRSFIMSILPEIKGMNCTVISHVSSIYTYNGIKSAQPGRLDIQRSEGCVLFDRGYWCTLEGYSESCMDGEVLWKNGEFEIVRVK